MLTIKQKNSLRNTLAKYNKNLILLMIALIVVFGAYLQVLGYDFVYDDIPLIKENLLIRKPCNIPSMLFMEDVIDDTHAGYYRPLIPMIDTLIYQIAGPSPYIFHAANVLYHLVSVTLVFFLVKRVVGSASSAFVGALFFGLHPANTESVTFVSGKNNVICAVFTLCTILSYLRYKSLGRTQWLYTSLGFFFLGLLSKEFAVMLPVFFGLIALLGPRERLLEEIKPVVLFVGVLLVYFVFRIIVLNGVVGTALEAYSFLERLLSIPDLLVRYGRLVLFPINQKALYDVALVPSGTTIISTLILIVLFWVVWRIGHLYYWVLFGFIWFFIFLVPVMNIVPIGGAALAERHVYISLAGAAVIAGGVFDAVSRKKAVLIVAFILVALGVLTILRSPVWRTDEALYGHMIEATPTSYKGYYNLGNMRYREGNRFEARKLWLEAVKRKPDMYGVYNNLGVLAEEAGNFKAAEVYYRKVLEVKPVPEVWQNLGNVLKAQGKWAEAARSYRKAMEGGKRNAVEAALKLSVLYESLGWKNKAYLLLQETSKAYPEDYRPHNLMGVIMGEFGRYKEARMHFERALDLAPHCSECLYNIKALKEANKY